MLSNNQCIIEIILTEKYDLKKNHDWMIFILDSKNQKNGFDLEYEILNIQFIKNQLKFIIPNKNEQIFTLDESYKKINKYTYNINFNYMNFV